MHPYLILLLLPLFGIAVFWLLPIPQSILSYLGILLLSGLLYWIVVRAMKKRHTYGIESMIGAEAKVVSRLSPRGNAQYTVRFHGELWNANSSDQLELNEKVIILSVNGLTLLVTKTKDVMSGSQE
jgi:membrane protein implicated in regulation of membrane protease activity